jgi:hypothetical protein
LQSDWSLPSPNSGSYAVVQEGMPHDLFDDLRFGTSLIRKHPGLSAATILTFTLGLGLRRYSIAQLVILAIPTQNYATMPQPAADTRGFEQTFRIPRRPVMPD